MVDYLEQIFIAVSHAVMVPCMALLVCFLLITVWELGGFFVEWFTDRRKLKTDVPAMVKEIHKQGWDNVGRFIESSKLLKQHKQVLKDFIAACELPHESRIAVAQRLLADVETKYEKTALPTDIIAKIAPMMGLLCTLIPLGPGIIALSEGDPATLSQSLSIAFNATIVGLLNAGVCNVISMVRKYWYNDYLVTLESLMEVIDKEVREADMEEEPIKEHIWESAKKELKKEAKTYA